MPTSDARKSKLKLKNAFWAALFKTKRLLLHLKAVF